MTAQEEIAQLIAERTRRANLRPTETPTARIGTHLPALAEEYLVPHTPLEAGLMLAGPAGKIAGTGARVGVAALGAALTPTDAEAGVVGKVGRKIGDLASQARSLFDYSKIGEIPDVPQRALPRYEPPRGVSERVQDLVESKKVRQMMLDKIEAGTQIGPGAEKFYNTEPLRQAFIDELGRKRGPEAFGKYMDYVAATSPRSAVPANVRNASYYYGLDFNKQPMPRIGAENPQPYGHMAQRLHQQNAAQIAAEGGWDVMKNPKPASFSQNLQGNFTPVTVDAHAFKLPAMLSRDPEFLAGAVKLGADQPTVNPTKMLASGQLSMEDALTKPVYWASKPNRNEYAAMENYYSDLAREAGLPAPAMGQAAAWAGGGPITGLKSFAGEPFLKSVENRVVLTAQERGITPAEALSQFIRGKAPLLTAPPAAAMGGLAAQDQYRQQENVQ